ncbi:MAG: alpha/beta hydrolase [Meiothermus sp.]|nr:alpha/beta hydrolase [Meiothermus sp.]
MGGSGPPLLLLHGYPQTHTIWHRVVPYLVEHFTVVVSDLRGYGDSSKPVGSPDHSNYSKRAMAQDQVELMAQLGFDSFYLAGHDRGGRVSHRLALDHPQRVKKLALLDISPTLKMYQQTDMTFASAYYHWFFLIQPAPFPETLIGAAPQVYLEKKMTLGSAGKAPFAPEAWAEYVRCFTPETIHASCEDYRAAATIDLDHDRESIAKGQKIQCPLLVLWGQHGVIERCFKPLEDWAEVAADVRGKALPGGHYLAEELPQQTSSELIQFFKERP